MSTLDSSQIPPGLRERKKQQTRETIARCALRLFAERGYDETTLAEIAAAANVAPRTIFAYFESKEDILFCDEPRFVDELKRRLDERSPGTTTVDVMREFVSSIELPTDDDRLRKRVLMATPSLQMKMRAHHAQLEPMFAESLARDLDSEPGDPTPTLVAAAMMAALNSVRDQFMSADSGGTPFTRAQGIAVLDQVLDFLRGGLEAVRRSARA